VFLAVLNVLFDRLFIAGSCTALLDVA